MNISKINLNKRLQNINLTNPYSEIILRMISLANLDLFYPSLFLSNYLDSEKRFIQNRIKNGIIKSPEHFNLRLDMDQTEIQNNKIFQMFSFTQLIYPFCKELKNDGQCKSCIKGYTMKFSIGKCKKIKLELASGCKIMLKKKKCKVCHFGYYLSNGRCIISQEFEQNRANSEILKEYKKRVFDENPQSKIEKIQINKNQIGTPKEENKEEKEKQKIPDSKVEEKKENWDKKEKTETKKSQKKLKKQVKKSNSKDEKNINVQKNNNTQKKKKKKKN